MSGTTVSYDASLPNGMKVVVLNNNDVVLSIANTWIVDGVNHHDAFVAAPNKSISMTSVIDNNTASANDEACHLTDPVTGGLKIKDFKLTGLSFPQAHLIYITIAYGPNTIIYYNATVKVLGEMDIPVVESATISPGVKTTAIVKVSPHKGSDLHPLKLADLDSVTITAKSQTETQTLKYPISEDGKYDFTGLKIGDSYTFHVFQTNKTLNTAHAVSTVPALTIPDANAFPAEKLSTSVLAGTVTVKVAQIEIADVDGSPQEKANARPVKVTLVAAKVPANILDVAKYLPADGDYTEMANFSGETYFSYDNEKKVTTFKGGNLAVEQMNGLTLKYKARYSFVVNGTASNGSFCALQSVSVDAISEIAAPNTYAAAANPVTGLQLVGYEYSIVKEDKSEQPNIIGKWSCDGELIIAGSTTAKKITLSAFDGIAATGLTTRPGVTLRPPTITFIHDKKESPYYRIAKSAVYAKVGDFSWTNFTAAGTTLAREKLALVGSDLKIDGKQWLAVSKASIKSGLAHKDTDVATIDMAASVAPSVAISLGAGNAVNATFTVSDVQSHVAFATSQSTQQAPATLKYYIFKTSDFKTAEPYTRSEVTRDGEGKLQPLILAVARGSKNYYSIMAEVKKGDELIGASAILPIPNLDIIPGTGRALVGKYACDPAEITSGELAHAAGVGASFAVDYDGRLSVDQKVADFADDHLYSADYQMSGVQSLNTDQTWSDVAGAVVTRFSPVDADNKAILKKACFRITGVTGLKKHRVLLARHYKLISDNSVKIADTLPVHLEFTPTVRPNTPVFTAKGSANHVHVVFANGVADSEAVLAKGLRNDLHVEGSDITFSSESEFSKTGLTGTFAHVQGARSYENPNATVADMVLADAARVSSDKSARTKVNIDTGLLQLQGAAVSTVYLTEIKQEAATLANPARSESYSTKFMCNAASDSSASAEVTVYYDEAGFDKDVSKTYQLTKGADGTFSHTLATDQLRVDLGLSDAKFMAASLKSLFTAYKDYSQTPGVPDVRRSVPVSPVDANNNPINYTPKMKPTILASDFSVAKSQGQLIVSTGALSQVKLGGNTSLAVILYAKSASATSTITNTLVSEAKTFTFSNLQGDVHEVTLVIQSGAYVGATPIGLGKYRPETPLTSASANTFAVIAGDSTSSLKASWINLTGQEAGEWALSSRRIYITGQDNGVTKYYVASANTATTTTTRSAFKSVSTSSVEEILSGLPIGKALTVALETTYTKTGESDLVVSESKVATCAGAPIFKSFTLEKSTNTVNALINQNGSAITNFWLFAKYDGAQGTVYFNVTPSQNQSLTGNILYKVAMPTTGPKPSGVMGILVNSYGAVTNGSPAGTFDAPAAGNVPYNAGDPKVEKQLPETA